MARLFAIVSAVLLHVGFILFGGLIFNRDAEKKGALQEVELLGDEDVAHAKEKEPPEVVPETKQEEMETEEEPPPDAAEILRNLELSAIPDAPALEAASLSAIEDALRGGVGGGGDFAEALSFTSGGRIGGTGKAGALDQQLEGAFSLAEIDQKPRPIFQAAPLYPSALRDKKVEGVVTVIFVVDASGKVANPRVEKSSNSAFEKPAMDAVKQWKFEPAVRAGQRVGCKMRIPIRFQAR